MADAQRSRTIVLISLVTIAASLVAMAGWIFNIPGLQTVFTAFEAMKFNTALCFVLLGSALLTTQYSSHKYSLFFYILSSLVTLIALVTFFQNLFHFNTGLDQLFVKDGGLLDKTYPFPGRMSDISDACFLLMGIGFLILTVKRPVFNIGAQYLFHIVTVLSSIGIIGYLYRTTFFYGLSSVGPMAVQSVLLFFFISISASLLHPSLGITNLFTGQLVGNKMARRLFILIIFVVITIGTLRIKTQHYYQFSIELWVALVTVCFLSICLLVIWNTAKWLNGIDQKRSTAEDEIKLMNADLEKRVEERTAEFQKSEEKYRLLIEHASDAIYVVDLHGNFTDVNDSMCRMTGYSREELLKLNVETIIDPEELQKDPIKHGPRRPGEATVRERRFIRKDGSLFDAEISVKGFADDKVLIMARDVTERKKMEEGLVEAEARFRTLAEKSMVGVYISKSERFIYVNPRFAEIFGYEPDELIGTDESAIDMIISEDHRHIVRGNVQARYRGDIENAHYEVKGKRKDGTTNWIEFFGSRVMVGGEAAIIGTMLDITERKEAEDLITKEKMLSDTIINSLPGIFYLITEKGKQVRWNANLETLTGYSDGEIEHLTTYDLIASEDHEKVKKTIEKVFEEGYAAIEASLIAKDGAKTPMLLTGTPILYEGGRCLLGMGIDISSRIKAEEELKEAEIKFRTLADQSMVGVYIFQDGQFVYVNPRFAEIFGYEPHELIGTYPVEVIIHQDYRDTVRENVRKRMEDEVASIHYEVMGLRKDGSSNWIEFYGNRVLIDGHPTIIGSMLDITERKLAEELLLKEKTLSETIINSLPGIFYLQNEGGDYLRWNKNFETVMGYTREEILKMKSREMVAPEDLERVRNTVMKIFTEGSAVVEANGLTKDGTLIPFLITSVPIIYQDQQCILGTGIDISSRIKAQEELRLSEQKYKLLFESNPVPLWMIAKDDLSIIAVNDAVANLYGYTKNELLHMNVTELRPEEDRTQQIEGYRKDISDSTDIGVIRHLKKDGTIMIVQIIAHDIVFEGRPVRLSLTNDITERVMAEEALKKSEANLQTILKTTDTAYALLDMELKVLEFNQKAVQFVKEQYHHVVVKGDRLGDYFPKDRLPQFVNFAREVLSGKSISYEIDYPQANGSVFWFYVRLFPIVNENQEILGMMMALYDITERKNTENDLKNAYGQIQTQISSIKGMAWKQSHLMRSPLANLKALADLLKEHPADIESLAHFQTELDRLDAIIHEMAQDASDHVL